MFLFTAPLYEILAAEVNRACVAVDPEAGPSEQIVELRKGSKEMVFRFTVSRSRRRQRLLIRSWRLLTWYDDRLCTNDFDIGLLRKKL